MLKARSKKRHEGNAEAGASKNALDIGTPGLLLTMDELMKLPHVELVTEFKCIEGWSNVTQWGGVRLRDLIDEAARLGDPPRFNGAGKFEDDCGQRGSGGPIAANIDKRLQLFFLRT